MYNMQSIIIGTKVNKIHFLRILYSYKGDHRNTNYS